MKDVVAGTMEKAVQEVAAINNKFKTDKGNMIVLNLTVPKALTFDKFEEDDLEETIKRVKLHYETLLAAQTSSNIVSLYCVYARGVLFRDMSAKLEYGEKGKFWSELDISYSTARKLIQLSHFIDQYPGIILSRYITSTFLQQKLPTIITWLETNIDKANILRTRTEIKFVSGDHHIIGSGTASDTTLEVDGKKECLLLSLITTHAFRNLGGDIDFNILHDSKRPKAVHFAMNDRIRQKIVDLEFYTLKVLEYLDAIGLSKKYDKTRGEEDTIVTMMKALRLRWHTAEHDAVVYPEVDFSVEDMLIAPNFNKFCNTARKLSASSASAEDFAEMCREFLLHVVRNGYPLLLMSDVFRVSDDFNVDKSGTKVARVHKSEGPLHVISEDESEQIRQQHEQFKIQNEAFYAMFPEHEHYIVDRYVANTTTTEMANGKWLVRALNSEDVNIIRAAIHKKKEDDIAQQKKDEALQQSIAGKYYKSKSVKPPKGKQPKQQQQPAAKAIKSVAASAASAMVTDEEEKLLAEENQKASTEVDAIYNDNNYDDNNHV